MGRPICQSCQRPKGVCYCHLIKPLDNLWAISILQHSEEAGHGVGTAKIAQLGLMNCQTKVLQDAEIFSNDGEFGEGVLVYPGESSFSFSELKKQSPKRLIFIDASWRKSKKIFLQSPYLQSLPKVSFSLPKESRYLIRKEPQLGYCSTLEAIVYVLEQVEDKTEKYKALLAVMDWMVHKKIEFMGSEVFEKNYD